MNEKLKGNNNNNNNLINNNVNCFKNSTWFLFSHFCFFFLFWLIFLSVFHHHPPRSSHAHQFRVCQVFGFSLIIESARQVFELHVSVNSVRNSLHRTLKQNKQAEEKKKMLIFGQNINLYRVA